MTTFGASYFSAGQKLSASKLNLLTDQIDLVSDAVVFDAVQTSTQSVANATDTPITFTTENVDSNGGHSTSSNTSRFTPTVSGYYLVVGQVGYANGSSTGRRGAKILRNGSGVTGTQILLSSGDDASILSIPVSGMVYLNGSTDYVEIAAIQDSGGSMNTTTGSEASRMTVSLIRNA